MTAAIFVRKPSDPEVTATGMIDVGICVSGGSKLPLCSLERKEAQDLMDQLWVCGVRPTEGQELSGQLKAIQYHLEDLRKLVFKEKKPK